MSPMPGLAEAVLSRRSESILIHGSEPCFHKRKHGTPRGGCGLSAVVPMSRDEGGRPTAQKGQVALEW